MELFYAAVFTQKAHRNSNTITGQRYGRTGQKPKLQFGFILNGVHTINNRNVVIYLEAAIPPSLLSHSTIKIPHVRIDLPHGFCDSNMTDVSPPSRARN
jgi:hypothetical protein